MPTFTCIGQSPASNLQICPLPMVTIIIVENEESEEDVSSYKFHPCFFEDAGKKKHVYIYIWNNSKYFLFEIRFVFVLINFKIGLCK